MRLVALLLAILATLVLAAVPTQVQGASNGGSGSSLSECTELYFLNSIRIYNTSYSGVLYLETPQNISFGGGLVQRVYVVYSYNLTYDNSSHYMKFRIKAGQRFFGYFVARVVLCGINMTRLSELEALALADPYAYPPRNESLPKDVTKFLGEPPRIVLEVAKPAFVRWFEKTVGAPPSNFSKLVIALYVAEFVKHWVRYEVSPYPRPLREIVEKRVGDCDDMSRLIIALLWSFGIPAVMADGYVVIWGLNYELPVESTLYVFHNAGPHAFVLAYAPGFGWIPIDLLAGSLTSNPFIFEGYTKVIRVNETAVKEFKRVSKQINATQVFYVFTPPQFYVVERELQSFVEKLFAPYEHRASASTLSSTTTTSTASGTAPESSSVLETTVVVTKTVTAPLEQRVVTVTSTVTRLTVSTVYTTALPSPWILVPSLAALFAGSLLLGLFVAKRVRR